MEINNSSPIGALEFAPVIRNILLRDGIKTVGDLIELEERELLEICLQESYYIDLVEKEIKEYRGKTKEGAAKTKILEDVRELLPTKIKNIFSNENARKHNNKCSILQLINMNENELVDFLKSIKGLNEIEVEKVRKIFSDYKSSKEYKDMMKELNEEKQKNHVETDETLSDKGSKTQEELEGMSEEELRQIIDNNEQIIANNKETIEEKKEVKNELIRKIISQQEIISNQRLEIAELDGIGRGSKGE